jgi:hypothetical protein
MFEAAQIDCKGDRLNPPPESSNIEPPEFDILHAQATKQYNIASQRLASPDTAGHRVSYFETTPIK